MGIPAALGVSASGLPPASDQADAVVAGTLSAVGPSPPFAFFGTANLDLYASFNTSLTTTGGSTAASVASAGAIAPGVAVKGANVPAGATWATFAGTSGTLAVPAITLHGMVDPPLAAIRELDSTAGLVGASVTGPGIPAGTTVLSITRAAVAATNDSPGIKGIVALSAAPTGAPVDPRRQPFVFARNGNAIATGVDAAAIFTGAAIAFTATIRLEKSYDGGFTWIDVGDATSLSGFVETERGVLYRLNCTGYSSGTVNYRISANTKATNLTSLI